MPKRTLQQAMNDVRFLEDGLRLCSDILQAVISHEQQKESPNLNFEISLNEAHFTQVENSALSLSQDTVRPGGGGTPCVGGGPCDGRSASVKNYVAALRSACEVVLAPNGEINQLIEEKLGQEHIQVFPTRTLRHSKPDVAGAGTA